MNVETIVNETSQLQKTKYYMLPFTSIQRLGDIPQTASPEQSPEFKQSPISLKKNQYPE
jgi:hypothetical protein